MRRFREKIIIAERIFDEHDWACFHDSILSAINKSYSQKKLEILFIELPNEIKFTAMQWGMNDTVFGDDVYRHFINLETQKSKYKKRNHNPKI